MTEEQLKSSPPQVGQLTEEEWSSWKEHPTTKIFRALMKKKLAEKQDLWMRGAYTAPDTSATIQLNSRAIGEAQLLRDIIELSVEDINTGMQDE